MNVVLGEFEQLKIKSKRRKGGERGEDDRVPALRYGTVHLLSDARELARS